MRKNTKHLDELVRRYFDAETTKADERELQRLLTETFATDGRYDEVRAVMGFTTMGRKLHHRSHRSVRLWQAAAAAVVVLLLGGICTFQLSHTDDVCIAYVNGRKVTNPEEVARLMQQEMQAVSRPTDAPTPEGQLKDMFHTLNP